MITPPTLLDALIAEAMWAAAIEAGAQPATAEEPAALMRSLWHAQRNIGQSGVVVLFVQIGALCSENPLHDKHLRFRHFRALRTFRADWCASAPAAL